MYLPLLWLLPPTNRIQKAENIWMYGIYEDAAHGTCIVHFGFIWTIEKPFVRCMENVYQIDTVRLLCN